MLCAEFHGSARLGDQPQASLLPPASSRAPGLPTHRVALDVRGALPTCPREGVTGCVVPGPRCDGGEVVTLLGGQVTLHQDWSAMDRHWGLGAGRHDRMRVTPPG